MSPLPRCSVAATSLRDAIRKSFIGTASIGEAGVLVPKQTLPGGSQVLPNEEENGHATPPPVAEILTKAANADAKSLGLMVALVLPDDVATRLAVPGGELPEELHLTLAYVGKLPYLPEDAVARVTKAVQAVASKTSPLSGSISGVGRFLSTDGADGEDVVYASFDCTNLTAFREALVAELEKNDIGPKKNHGFTPHITLAYVTPATPSPVERVETAHLYFDKVTVVAAGVSTAIPLTGVRKSENAYDIAVTIPILKADAEKRLVTGVVLEPDEVDAQKDTISPNEIELVAHRFLARYNRSTRLGAQHQIFGEIGVDLVESYIVPADTTIGTELVKKGSWVITVKVNDNPLWAKVKAGIITGFSIGGVATRI